MYSGVRENAGWDVANSLLMDVRENAGWDVANSLLMDGGFENLDINLHKVAGLVRKVCVPIKATVI